MLSNDNFKIKIGSIDPIFILKLNILFVNLCNYVYTE